MNKESETLEKLLSFAFVMGENMVGLTKGNYDEKTFIKKTYEYLQKYAISRKEQLALQQRLESIDNSSPSEALNDLQVIENNIIYILSDCDINDEVCQCLEYAKSKMPTIKQYILKAQEQEIENAKYKKVFELVKEKGVDISIIMSTKTVEEYNGFIQYCNSNLSEAEYNSLKEMFG